MPVIVVKTGIEGLDDDLRELFKANSAKRRDEIRAAIADHDLSQGELFAIVPKAILRLSLGLMKPSSSFAAVLKHVPDAAKPQLARAKEIIEQHFADILEHPSVLPVLDATSEEEDDDDDAAIVGAMGLISRIRHFPGWVGRSPRLRPSSKLVILGMDQELLLNSTCDWDDYLFICQNITEMLACEMEGGRLLAQHRMVDLPDKERIARRLRSLENNIERIKDLAQLYGVVNDGQDPPHDGAEVVED